MIITISLVNIHIDKKCKIKNKSVLVMKTQDLLSYQFSYITYSIHIGSYDFTVWFRGAYEQ